jgi:hypothetical protein
MTLWESFCDAVESASREAALDILGDAAADTVKAQWRQVEVIEHTWFFVRIWG